MNKNDRLIELDELILQTLIDKIKDSQATSADYANALKYLSQNNFQNITSKVKELAKSINDLPTYENP